MKFILLFYFLHVERILLTTQKIIYPYDKDEISARHSFLLIHHENKTCSLDLEDMFKRHKEILIKTNLTEEYNYIRFDCQTNNDELMSQLIHLPILYKPLYEIIAHYAKVDIMEFDYLEKTQLLGKVDKIY